MDIKENDILRLTANGAYDESRGEYYGAKGQLVRVVKHDPYQSLYVLLSARPNQCDGEFYIETSRLEKI